MPGEIHYISVQHLEVIKEKLPITLQRYYLHGWAEQLNGSFSAYLVESSWRPSLKPYEKNTLPKRLVESPPFLSQQTLGQIADTR